MDDELFEFLGAVFACEIQGKPYQALQHSEAVIYKAIENGDVSVFMHEGEKALGFTLAGHHEYCQERSRRAEKEKSNVVSARLIDLMETNGIISVMAPDGSRKVLKKS